MSEGSTSGAGHFSARLPHIFYGGDYNPEQWPESVWHDDVRLMREAGVNIVTLGVFSWARLEPQPGQYEFGWLDTIMDLLHANGMMVDLATATASPPPWLAALHPDSLPVTKDGTRLWTDSRQAYCPSSPAFRERAAALVTRLAERYTDHPALAMWHIGNEYACHVPACYCDISAAAFRAWLEKKYGTLDALNEVWGTAFWSQNYARWNEINPPRAVPSFVNPTQQLDFARFSDTEILACFEAERAIVKAATPDLPVTTNFMNFFKPLDYWQWAAHEDVVSTDSYPDPGDPDSTLMQAMAYDLMRSLGEGRAWLLMEQTPSNVNWRGRNTLKHPGQMRALSYQAVARGANGVMFFQWRAAKAGAEKFHGAFVPHVGTENSRVWREVSQLGAELKTLDPVLDTRVQPEVAIVFDWDNWWALEQAAHPSSDISMLEQATAYYRPLFARNIATDFVRPDSDLSRYKVVLVPNLYMVRDSAAQNLEDFVAKGGTLVMSFFSGIVDESDHIRLGGYPAPFRRMLGLRVEEFDAYVVGQSNRLRLIEGDSYGCDLWADVIDLEGAQALATFADDFYAGRAAITRHSFGDGTSYYVGTRPDAAAMAWLLQHVCDAVSIHPTLTAPATVEAVRRTADDASYLFAINHSTAPATLALDSPATDMLTGAHHTDHLTLDPYGVAILREG